MAEEVDRAGVPAGLEERGRGDEEGEGGEDVADLGGVRGERREAILEHGDGVA